MALVVADRVQETTNTTGVGTLTLAGAVAGFQSFSVIGNANTTFYTIISDNAFEIGIGTYTLSGTTLSRDTVLTSSLGGTTKISVTSGSFVFCTYPATKSVNQDGVKFVGSVILRAGTAAAGTYPLDFQAGILNTIAEAGAFEYDTANTIAFFTGNTTNGRGLLPATQYNRLVVNGANTATTISPFFGAASSIPLVTNGVYEIEIECYYNKNTAGTLVWTLTNSAVVTNLTVNILTSPIAGYTNVPTASTTQLGALVTQTAAAVAFAATGTVANNATMWSRFKIILENAASTSIRLNVTNSAGTITPLRGSFWKATRITNVGTYAA